ncbi:MAG: DUF480 domain-containing protein [Planctomycetaceae bacterium]|nr:DUF480 domain-containing protein [Planctomycetaceae bacterium]
MTQDDSTQEPSHEHLAPLSKKERRVLGTLIEKSLTTPEYYPLTIKALTTGCNQKSNRSPLSSYDEYDAEEILDGLRSRGLIAAVQTAGGRAERYRHLLRDQVGWKNASLAIMAELLLRGRQQLGELRSRANRMATIDSLDQLREELRQLMQNGYVQASGDLHRRGIEVDHGLYLDTEQNKSQGLSSAPGQSPQQSPRQSVKDVSEPQTESINRAGQSNEQQSGQTAAISEPQIDYRDEIEELKNMVLQLEDRISELERQLGV